MTFMYISPKMSAYSTDFHETKYMSLLIKDDELLEKYNKSFGKIKNSIKTEFDSQRVYNDKYLKAKIKPFNEKNNSIIKYERKIFNLFVYL